VNITENWQAEMPFPVCGSAHLKHALSTHPQWAWPLGWLTTGQVNASWEVGGVYHTIVGEKSPIATVGWIATTNSDTFS
jgi:hypothetical protein